MLYTANGDVKVKVSELAMAPARALVECLVVVLALSWQLPGIQAQLSSDYYAATCPNVEQIVASTFVTQMNLIKIITAPASLLRVAFHDCAVGGCDGSIMLDSQGSITDEKDSERNLGISNLDVIDAIKQNVESRCPGEVSCADIIALVGREAVRFAGGPQISILLGRKDSLTTSTSAAQSSLLPGDATVSQVLSAFASMGIKTQGAVALMGAHTLGVSHCANFENRLYPQPDATLSTNILFQTQLRSSCPQIFKNPNTVVANDNSNIQFDTQYFTDATVSRRGLLSIDDALANDPRTAPFMQGFASNSALFFQEFSKAYEQMTRFKVLTGAQGQVRLNCRSVN